METKQWFRELGAGLKTKYPERNIIVPADEEQIETFRKKHNNCGVYSSIFEYDNENIRKGKKRGPLYFDLDGPYALEDARSLIENLQSFGCPIESIRLYYSGNKGFHVVIPFESLKIEPEEHLEDKYRAVAENLDRYLYLSSLDFSIYDRVRLWRIPNSIHEESKLYKIPLSISELAQPLENIKKLATTPRFEFEYPEWKIWESFLTYFESAQKPRSKAEKYSIFDPTGEGSRNKKTFLRALAYKKEKYTFDEALTKCKGIADVPPLPEWEIERTVYSAYQEKYQIYEGLYKNIKKVEQGNMISTSFLRDKETMYEEIYDPEHGEPVFAAYNGKEVSLVPSVVVNGKTIVPISSDIVTTKTVLFPSGVEPYESDSILLEELISFIHTYVDTDFFWKKWSAYYILLSWLYDKLPVIPYICALGPSNTGKTRYIQTIGTLCYKPFFASGSISSAGVFRVLNQFRGTLIINEFDYIASFNHELTTILNNGYEANLPVVRIEGDQDKVVKTYWVYGPKLFSSRKRKNDWAFESRLLTVPMKETRRKDVPPFLLDEFHLKALHLRNKLLMYRFRHYFDTPVLRHDLFPNVHGRLRQTLLALVSVIDDQKFLDSANTFAEKLSTDLQRTQEFDFDVVVARIITDSWKNGNIRVSFQGLLQEVRQISGQEYISSRTLGAILRDELRLMVKRSGQKGNYEVFFTEKDIQTFIDRYGFCPTEPTEETEVKIEHTQERRAHE